MDDVADFVVEYINSDVRLPLIQHDCVANAEQVLGMIAINWLIIADQKGIFDADCLKLSQLHSDAVDYP